MTDKVVDASAVAALLFNEVTRDEVIADEPAQPTRSQHRRSQAALSLRVGRCEFLLDVLTPVQHTHDFRHVLDDPVEDDVRRGGERA